MWNGITISPTVKKTKKIKQKKKPRQYKKLKRQDHETSKSFKHLPSRKILSNGEPAKCEGHGDGDNITSSTRCKQDLDHH